jgi:RHS repeat-associated protein
LQDLIYSYDPIGNITQLQDNAQQTLYYNNSQVPPASCYKYDPLYRLIQAGGRELLGLGGQAQPTTWDDTARLAQPLPPNASDGQAVGNYTENYSYDPVGNIQTLAHTVGTAKWTRTYTYDFSNPTPTTNRLTSTLSGSVMETYAYDYDGNMKSITYLPSMQWDFKDQLQATAQQVVRNGGVAQTTYYVYDSSGQRALKFTKNLGPTPQTGVLVRERIYLGNYESYREYESDGVTVESEIQTVHVMDDKRRVAMVETSVSPSTSSTPTTATSITRYQFNNHLGSAILELDDNALLISYEEYYPYGSTAYQAVDSAIEVSAKQYRYTGKERDIENGLYYHGARYYAPWLGRWVSCDPKGLVDGTNLFAYGRDNPIIHADRTGTQCEQTCVDPTAPTAADEAERASLPSEHTSPPASPTVAYEGTEPLPNEVPIGDGVRIIPAPFSTAQPSTAPTGATDPHSAEGKNGVFEAKRTPLGVEFGIKLADSNVSGTYGETAVELKAMSGEAKLSFTGISVSGSALELSSTDVVGNRWFGVDVRSSSSLDEASLQLGYVDKSAGIRLGASLATTSQFAGINILGGNVGYEATERFGFELGITAGKNEEGTYLKVDAGPVSGSLKVGVAKGGGSGPIDYAKEQLKMLDKLMTELPEVASQGFMRPFPGGL